jgi:hypothetical protein
MLAVITKIKPLVKDLMFVVNTKIKPLAKDLDIVATAPPTDLSYIPAIITDEDLFNTRMKHHGYLLSRLPKIHSAYEVLE